MRPTTDEEFIRHEFVRFFCDVAGFGRREATKVIDNAIAECKREAAKEGTDKLPPNLGDLILAGEPYYPEAVARAREDFATDEDIRQWWNQADLQRRMMRWSEMGFARNEFQQAMESGLDERAATLLVRQRKPVYDDMDKFPVEPTGENRALSQALRLRVDRFIKANDRDAILGVAAEFASFNAFVRACIHVGRI